MASKKDSYVSGRELFVGLALSNFLNGILAMITLTVTPETVSITRWILLVYSIAIPVACFWGVYKLSRAAIEEQD